jgi:hypothetical protein
VLYLGLRFVHILLMAAWFAPHLFMAGDARRTIEGGGDLGLLRGRLALAGRVGGASGTLTLLTGVALIFLVGGFGAVSPAIHVGLLLGLAMWFVGLLGTGGTARKIDAAIAAGATKEALLPLARRLSMFTGIFHLLWVVTLLLMVFRNYRP